MRKSLAVALSLIFSFGIVLLASEPDSPDDVIFVNSGMMNIQTGGVNDVAIYIPFGMRMVGSSEIVLNGEMNVGGNLYQDATTAGFKVSGVRQTSTGFSTGKFRFVKSYGSPRIVSPQNRAGAYDRGANFVAFPNLVLASNDNIEIDAQSGIDAISFKRDNGFSGRMILKSDRSGDNVYDASLRITGTGSSSTLVDPGTVIVEREMSYYRSAVGSEKIFGFATPFKDTQYSGYFAGNWVRRPIADQATGHTRYVFADEKGDDDFILKSQYIYNPLEKLQPAQAYLIKPRPPGFNYQALRDDSNGLTITDGDIEGGAYDQSKFVFDGKVYSFTQYDEQLFADDVLYQSPHIASTTSTINWLIGNSYTAPIDVDLLADAMKNSPLRFSPNIWVWPKGATTYHSHRITGTDNIIVEDLTSIPAMNIFMIRVQAGTAPGSFAITKNMLRHNKVTHSVDSVPAPNPAPQMAPRSVTSGLSNQVIFRVTPDDNNRIYDIAAVGIRNGASEGSDSYDQAKVYNASDVFQLYTLSSQNARLSANGVPPTTQTVRMGFRPVSQQANFIIRASHQETLQTEGLWLEDTKTGNVIDLMFHNSYTFSSVPGDNEERFRIHFVAPEYTGLNTAVGATELHIFNNQNRLTVSNLTSVDVGSEIAIFSAAGRLIQSVRVDNYPRMELNFDDSPGVYVLHLRGVRNGVHKFIIRK